MFVNVARTDYYNTFMIFDNSHRKSSDVAMVLHRFTIGVGLESLLLKSYQALIFYNQKPWDPAASVLYSACDQWALKNRGTLLGVDIKGLMRDNLKARSDSISWVNSGV